MIESEPPDLVFMDIGLPGMNGHERCQTIAAKLMTDACYLVALSGYGHESDVQKSIEAGFDHHLVKPVTLERLLELLNRLADVRGDSWKRLPSPGPRLSAIRNELYWIIHVRVGCVEQARTMVRLRSRECRSVVRSVSPAPKAACADAPWRARA